MTFICVFTSFLYARNAGFKHEFSKDRDNLRHFFWELLFLLDFTMNFFVDFYKQNPLGGKLIERDISKISVHYYETEFWRDFIPLIPLQCISMNNSQQYVFYIIKVIRIHKGYKLLDVRKGITWMLNYQIEKIVNATITGEIVPEEENLHENLLVNWT